MTESQKMFEDLLRRRMAVAKAGALYQEAEAAMMQTMMMESMPGAVILAGAHRGKAKRLMTAADHIVKTELVEE